MSEARAPFTRGAPTRILPVPSITCHVTRLTSFISLVAHVMERERRRVVSDPRDRRLLSVPLPYEPPTASPLHSFHSLAAYGGEARGMGLRPFAGRWPHRLHRGHSLRSFPLLTAAHVSDKDTHAALRSPHSLAALAPYERNRPARAPIRRFPHLIRSLWSLTPFGSDEGARTV